VSLLLLLAVLAWLPLLVIDAVFATEVAAGLAASRRAPALATGPQRIALLVPAHNEEGVVRASVAAMRAASPPGTKVLVVAHNCSDRTAEEAMAGGALVHRLDEPDRRGKGYALAGGRDALALDPPEVVVVIDADCTPDTGSIATLAATAVATGRVAQASYLFRPRPDASPIVQISSFAMLVKNLVRQRGARRIGGPALLTGSGMAFPWASFATLDLATGNIVEDLALGVELVASGRPPVFEERAIVWSTPSNEAGTGTQRARWEGGFVATARRFGLPLLGRGLLQGRWAMIWMGLHLLVLPLTLVLAANAAALGFWALLWLFGLPPGPALFELGVTAFLALLVLAAWAAAGRAMLAGTVLLRLPFYLLWKIALYARILRKREEPAWVRTERVE
jgi:cellulose synthase/poly-beta-1,6-N-acetylglucosamine synthase-like glycosyltransferase